METKRLLVRKILFLTALCLYLANAAMAQTVASGTTGDCTWTITGTSNYYTLTITGYGKTGSYSNDPYAPWYAYREKIRKLDIQQGVTHIGNFAFYYCNVLTSITIPNSVKSIGQYAFQSCRNVHSISIGNSVESIGAAAFGSCHRLTSVTIPNSVKFIGNNAFQYCDDLASITIPNSVDSIGRFVFRDCIGLTSVTLPNSITTIREGTFSNCTALTSITIPHTITAIEQAAFTDCIGLVSIIDLNPIPQTTVTWAFENVPLENVTLYVPAESVEAYKAAFVWRDFGTITAYRSVAIDAPAPAAANTIHIYPNPVSDNLYIEGTSYPAQVTIIDLSGKTVLWQNIKENESISVNHLSKGIYLVRINGKTVKLMKN
jgi:hypothetical protein